METAVTTQYQEELPATRVVVRQFDLHMGRNDPVKLAKCAVIQKHHVALFAAYLEKLRSTPDGDGSLPLTNLQVTLLDKMGAPAEKLGDSTGQFKELSELRG